VILVDTSVWIDHLRHVEPALADQLDARLVLMHPFVLGEVACGNLRQREVVLPLMRDLPQAPSLTDDEALGFIDRHRLMGRGIGYIDIHLLGSTALSGSTGLWTRDKRLAAVADDLGLRFTEVR
jgi:predicted nucleic acid-binding protein